MKKLLLFIFVFTTTLQAQTIKGKVTDQLSNQALAFVTIVEEGTQNGTYSDIDGYFSIKLINENSSVVFSYLGFQTETLIPEKNILWNVTIRPQAINIKEVKILPGENPAEVIMRKVLKNKDKNNPEKAIAFTYDSYNKLIFVADRDTNAITTQKVEVSIDSTKPPKKDFFEDKHLFLLESATHRKHMPPGKDEEVILATRVSGLKNPQFALLGTQLQSFSLYGDHVSVMDDVYLSPLSNDAINKYLFILEDSTMMNDHMVYTISFRPRKNKNFVGLKGNLFISTDGWALQNVLASPADSNVSVRIRIQQQYTKKDGVWFPEQLNSFLSFPNMEVNNTGVMGISKSYLRNVKVNPPLRKRDFGPIVLRMAPKATQVSDSVWSTYRERELDVKEAKTYVYMDSVGKAENFERKLQIYGMLATGKIPIKFINIDVARILRVNNFEGVRLGAGIHTNDFLSEKFSVGGYYAYGFRDEDHKFGGDALVHLYRKRNAWIRVSYEEDVIETGGRQLDPAPARFINTHYYPFFISRMDQYTKKEAQLNGRLIGTLSTLFFVNQQEISSFPTNAFYYPRTEDADLIIRKFNLEEAGVTVRWAPGEKLALAGNREVSLGSKWPVFYARYTIGKIEELDRQNNFDRWDAMIEKTFKTTLYGDITIRSSMGYVSDPVPSSLYYNARGTNTINFERNRYVGIASPFTFETMRTNEFLHSEFIAIQVRHDFRDLLIKSKKFNPHISLVHNILWGNYIGKKDQYLVANIADKGFMESGIYLDNLLKVGFTGIGIAAFYRYGTYALEKTEDNIVMKLSVGFSF
ncbi:MAG: carboxypeptidase-like regulatory domain-containing protein [Bacteroidetes bacterium]|nr:carboxypeptidase-like regulatory domain-containing protein [Bacteroidota bacterium]